MSSGEALDATVDAESAALPSDMRSRLSRISFLIEEFGVKRVREPHVKHLQGPMWEMRMTGRDGISRALYVAAAYVAAAYVAAEGCRVVIVRVFVKKTQKIPNRELKRLCEGRKGLYHDSAARPARPMAGGSRRPG